MSQVIIAKDSLSLKRQKSRAQEQQIDRSDSFRRWQLNDIVHTKSPLYMAVRIALLPLALLWAGLLLGVAFAVAVFSTVMSCGNQLLKFFGKQKS